MENIHFESEVLLVPLKLEYQVSAFWMWADNQVKEWHNQQFNNCSASDQLPFFYSRVNTVDKAKYVEHRHTKKPKQQIKTKLVAPYPQGRAQPVLLQPLLVVREIPVEANFCEREVLHTTGRELCQAGQGGWALLGSLLFMQEMRDKGINCSLEWELNQPEISKGGQGRCRKLRLMMSLWWFKYRLQYLRCSK